MEVSKSVKKIIVSILIGVMCLWGAIATILALTLKTNTDSYTSSTLTTSNAVFVGEIWDSTNKKFSKDNAAALLATISSDGSGKIEKIESDLGSDNVKTASEIFTQKSSKSIVVTLGGIKWIVTYLSKDKSGNVVATLYQADSSTTTSTFGNGSYYGTNSPTSGVPTNMYGTSYIRAVTLNNGGYYINITSNNYNPSSVGLKATQSSAHEYALFTVPSLGLTQHLVQPLNVSWQESGQTATSILGFSYNLSNESWSDSVADTGFYNSSYNYAGNYYSNVDGGQSGNGDWKYDYLWLPSLSETGYSGTNGIWKINENERSSNSNTWVRSADGSLTYREYGLIPSGANYSGYGVMASRAVRPSLHLNLKSIYDNLFTTINLDSQSGSGGTTSVDAYYNKPMSLITPPTRSGFAFGGYFSSTNGSGTKYYNADGTSATTYPAENGPTTLYAYWIPLYSLTINSGNSNLGSAYGTQGEYLAGSNITIHASPKVGYSLLYWSVKNANGTEISKIYENEYTLTMPTHNVTYTAVFGKGIEGIQVAATYGGTATVVGDNYESLESTDTITLVATVCVTGYQFKHWINQDGTILASGEENKTYLIPKSQAMDSIITAVFEPIT